MQIATAPHAQLRTLLILVALTATAAPMNVLVAIMLLRRVEGARYKAVAQKTEKRGTDRRPTGQAGPQEGANSRVIGGSFAAAWAARHETAEVSRSPFLTPHAFAAAQVHRPLPHRAAT